jgi:5-formyltetrahydrofolate cyclo-ligase
VTAGAGESATDKAEARRSAAARRGAWHAHPDRAGAERTAQAHLARWLAERAGAVLSGYLPIRSEIDPVPVMAGYAGPVGVPVIDGPGLPLRFRRWWSGAALVRGPFGAMVPEAADELVPQILIVPLLAWDRRGYRLGYGGGFYDRTLEDLRARGPVIAVGFAHALQQVAVVPTDPFDQRLDFLVSEEGVLPFL